jgi:hypothetical protein
MLITQEKNMSQSNDSNGSSGLFKAQNSPDTFQITSAIGGSLSKLTYPIKHKKEGSVSTSRGDRRRKAIKGFSNSSRLRFMREMANVDFSKIQGRVLFATLTYPRDKWSLDSKIWKRDLQKFKYRLDRKYGKTSGFWRLELHGKDGSLHPHFHLLLVLDQTRISNKALADIRAFVANAWYEVCGKISDDHLLAGSQVIRVKSRRDWDHLIRYVAKKEKLQDESLTTGRVWAVWSKDLLPIEFEVVEVRREDAFKIRRWMRRLAGKRRGMGLLLEQKVFIRYENMVRLLAYLKADHDQQEEQMCLLR